MADFASDAQIHGRTLTKVLSLFFFITIFFPVSGQRLSSENKKALKLYEKGQEKAKARDFVAAIDLFTKAALADPDFYEPHLRKGSLYNAMGVEDSVYTNFTKYLSLTKFPIPSVLNRTALMSFRKGEYELSKKYLDQSIAISPKVMEDQELRLLSESIPFAILEKEKDSTLSIRALPREVNQFALQYLPTMTIDNSFLYYTKRDLIKGDEDIVVSKYQKGGWSKAESISDRINTKLNEGACSISADGRTLIFTSCDKRDSYGSCDLYISKKAGERWSRPKNIGKPVSSKYWESQPSLSADGKTLFFTSTRPGGFGGRDLWISNLIDGKWSVPKNLGKGINTFKDETTPFIHPNGETLYFSSNGHVGMGGFDLYEASLSDSIWSQVKNLGYPINTNTDEVALLIAGDGETAYFAKEEERNYQIVKSEIVSFKLGEQLKTKPATFIIGKVLNDDTSTPLRAKVEVYDLNQNEVLYQATSDSISGDYVMVLPSGKELGCYVKKKGYLFYEYNFYSEPNSLATPDTIAIRLKPIAINQTLVLRNIYFELNSYELNDKSKTEIKNIVEILEDNPTISVEISGHTDDIGTKPYNLTLSENRAREVYEELIHSGIRADRMTFVGYADERPLAANDSEIGRQSNRRIEFRVLRLEP